METAQKKVRSWCEECEAWHPRGEHITAGARPPAGVELRAEPRIEPRPASNATNAASAPRRAGLVGIALFLCVVLPIGIVAWTGAVYAVLQLLPHIRAALP
jgi:ferric-dicitrate binding protein FerR (iron transport regulator)